VILLKNQHTLYGKPMSTRYSLYRCVFPPSHTGFLTHTSRVGFFSTRIQQESNKNPTRIQQESNKNPTKIQQITHGNTLT